MYSCAIFLCLVVQAFAANEIQHCMLDLRDLRVDLVKCEKRLSAGNKECPKCPEEKKCPDSVSAQELEEEFLAISASISELANITKSVKDGQGELSESMDGVRSEITGLEAEFPTMQEEVSGQTDTITGEIRLLEKKVAQWHKATRDGRDAELERLHGVVADKEHELATLKAKLLELQLGEARRSSCWDACTRVLRAVEAAANLTMNSTVEFAALEDARALGESDGAVSVCWEQFWPIIVASASVHVACLLWLIISCTLWWHRCCLSCCCGKKKVPKGQPEIPDNGGKDTEMGDDIE